MPAIDVTGAISSPLFQDSFSVTRRVQTVGNDGYVVITPTSLGTQYGVVYPSNENERRQLPDLTIRDKTVTIITRFALRGESEVSGTEYMADNVTWHGDTFVVRKVEDWSGYAAGFVMAICSSIDLTDAPVTTE